MSFKRHTTFPVKAVFGQQGHTLAEWATFLKASLKLLQSTGQPDLLVSGIDVGAGFQVDHRYPQTQSTALASIFFLSNLLPDVFIFAIGQRFSMHWLNEVRQQLQQLTEVGLLLLVYTGAEPLPKLDDALPVFHLKTLEADGIVQLIEEYLV